MSDQVTGFLSPFLRRRRLAAVSQHLHGRVLDYGCGVGYLANLVPPDLYVGVDIDLDSIKIARVHHPQHCFHVVEENADHGVFDTLVAAAVIEHLPAPEDVLKSWAGMLAPGGRIVLTTPDPHLEWVHELGAKLGLFSKEADDEHVTRIEKSALNEFCKTTGLKLIDYRRFLLGANQLAVLQAP